MLRGLRLAPKLPVDTQPVNSLCLWILFIYFVVCSFTKQGVQVIFNREVLVKNELAGGWAGRPGSVAYLAECEGSGCLPTGRVRQWFPAQPARPASSVLSPPGTGLSGKSSMFRVPHGVRHRGGHRQAPRSQTQPVSASHSWEFCHQLRHLLDSRRQWDKVPKGTGQGGVNVPLV